MKGNPPNGQNFGQYIWCTGCSFILEADIARHMITYQFLSCGPWLVCRALGRNMIRKLVTRRYGSEVCVPLNGGTCEDILSHVNGHQRVTSAEQYFNKQVF